MVSGSDDKTLKLWDTSSGKLLRTLSGHSRAVRSVAWSPDGRNIASGSADKTIRIWEASSGNFLRELEGHRKSVSAVAWNPKRNLLLSGSDDTNLRIWNVSSGRTERTISSPLTRSITSVAWSPDGWLVAAGHESDETTLWDATTGERLDSHWKKEHSGAVLSVAWSPDGRTLASGSADRSLKFWDVRSGEEEFSISGFSGPFLSVAWSPDGRFLATAQGDKSVTIRDGSSGDVVRRLGTTPGALFSVAWSPDGKTLATGSADTTLKLWDAGSGTFLRAIVGHSGSIWSVAWSPDGKILASGSEDNTVRLWDAASGEHLRTLSGHLKTVRSVDWSPDGRTLASGSEDGSIRLWDSSSGEHLHTLAERSSPPVWSVDWSPDGRTLASSSTDGSIRFWNTSIGKRLRLLSRRRVDVACVAWSPDGSILAVCEGSQGVELLDASTGKRLRSIPGQNMAIASVAWSPDESTLAAIGWGQTLQLWDTASGVLLRSFSGPSSSLLSVAWSPDGRALATGSSEGTASLWRSMEGLDWSLVALPGVAWLSYSHAKLSYVASPAGDGLAAVRFDSRTSPVYPLWYYREELKQSTLAGDPLQTSSPLQPKPLRHAWVLVKGHASRISLFLGLSLAGVAGVLAVIYRRNPMSRVRRFLSSAGLARVTQLDSHLLTFTGAARRGKAFALLWPEKNPGLPKRLVLGKGAATGSVSVYVFYFSRGPEAARAQLLKRFPCNVVPISTQRVENALAEGTSRALFQELDERFSIHGDPYSDVNPMEDPSGFHGRDDLLARMSATLRDGKHVCLLGLPRMGRTSMLKQLRHRAHDTAVVYMECQPHQTAEACFQVLADRLRTALERLRIPRLPPRKDVTSAAAFREEVLRFDDRWVNAGRREPFLLLLDGIDQLFLPQPSEHSEQLLRTYLRLLEPLRALALERECLAVLATSHRPHVNRQKLLTPTLGENPGFMFFQEHFLGALSFTGTCAVVEGPGTWKGIHWEPEALEELHVQCGGHPLLTRLLASDACEGGRRLHVTVSQVREAVLAVQAAFPHHAIGAYYRETLWAGLHDAERHVLRCVIGGEARSSSASAAQQMEETLTQFETYGLIRREEGGVVASALLRQWLVQREYE